jgi:hypothetical protein
MTDKQKRDKVILEISTIRKNLRIAIDKKMWSYVDSQIQRLVELEKNI